MFNDAWDRLNAAGRLPEQVHRFGRLGPAA